MLPTTNILNVRWTLTFKLIFISIILTKGQEFEFDLQPSFNLLEDTNMQNTEDSGVWSAARQSVWYQAEVGRLFNRSISEITAEYGVPKGEEFIAQVHIVKLASHWLSYSPDTHLIQGVPTNEHVGDYTLLLVLRREFADLTIPIKISVVKQAISIDEWDLKCAVNDPTTIMLLAITNNEEFDLQRRIDLLLKLASFFDQNPLKFRILYFTEAHPDDRVFLSGRGKDDSAIHKNNVDVSFTVGCGSDEEIPGLELLESASQDGSLEHHIGCGVVEWKVLNRIQHHNIRLRRALQNDESPSNSKLKAERITQGEESVPLKTRGRTRVQLNLIRNTPIVKPPVMASKFMTHKVIKPTNPPAPVVANQPPMAVFEILDQTPRISCYFEFFMPADAFFDKEDGDGKHLKLQLFNASNQMLIEEQMAWPRFNSEEQMMYGVPTPDTSTENSKLILMASDKEGTSTTTEFNLRVSDSEKTRPRNHRFTFYLTETEKNVSNDVFMSEFGRKLAIALARTDNNPGSLMMVKTDYAKNGQRYVVWYDEHLNSERLCYEEQLLDIGILMVGPNGVQGKNKPEKVFAGKFRPEYKLRTIKIEYIGPCSRKTTTSLPTTATMEETTIEEEDDETTAPIYSDDEFTKMPPIITLPPGMKTTAIYPTTTTEEKETTTQPPPPTPIISSPSLTGKLLPPVSAKLGKPTLFQVPTGVFYDPITSEENLELHLAPYNGNGFPVWLQYLPEKRVIVIFPTLADYNSLVKVNDSYSMWTIGLVAKNKNGKSSETLPIKIFVMKDQRTASDYNHEFQIHIANYDVKDFLSR